MKKITTIKIDEAVLLSAKKEGLNVSLFTENCLKAYLGFDNNIKDMQTELNNIKQSNLNLHILTEQNKNNDKVRSYDEKIINEHWLRLWNNYRANNGEYDNNIFKESVTVLNLNAGELDEMLNLLLLNINKFDITIFNNFKTAKEAYNSLNRGVDDEL